MMNTWISVRQALVALDITMRAWGRELGLDGSEVMVLLLIGQLNERRRSASEIAWLSGRSRQNVQRSLARLERRGIILPAAVSGRGTEAWSLTEVGIQLGARLHCRQVALESILDARFELADIALSLQLIVQTLVNRPTASGWARGLLIPHEARKDPEWDIPAKDRESLRMTMSPVDERAARVDFREDTQ